MAHEAELGDEEAKEICATDEVMLAFVEDRLGHRDRATFEAHLANCGACNALVAAATTAWFSAGEFEKGRDPKVHNFAIGRSFGPYAIVAWAGRGSMGEVYRARDARLSREVAIKMLPTQFANDPERLARFQREARATSGIAHPNTLTLFDVGTHEGIPYLVTEWLEGTTLRERLALGALPLKQLLHVGVQLASGLAAAHAKGVIHRDLKPANLFLCTDGRCKILDFGLARLAASLDEGAGTEAGTLLGTAGYMSPEQVRGEAADERADLFAVGAILYEMATGRAAFGDSGPVERMSATLRDEPPRVTGDLGAVIARCIAKEPRERFRSAHDLAFHLATLEARSDGLAERDDEPFPRASAQGSSKIATSQRLARARGWFGVVVVSVAAGFVLRMTTHHPGPPAERPVYRALTVGRAPILSARFTDRGQTVIYGAAENGTTQLYSVPTERPGPTRLNVAADVLAVSPHGELALLLDPALESTGRGTLARMDLGGAPRRLLDNVREADWSPVNGDLAVLHEIGVRARLEYPIGTARDTGEGRISSLRFSPRGDRIAYILHPNPADDAGAVMVLERDGPPHELAHGWSSAFGLAWGPSEPEEIFFAASRQGGENQLFAVNLAGQLRSVDRIPGRVELHDIAPDGRVLMDQKTVWAGLMVGSTDRERDLTWSGASRLADFSPDGRTVLFMDDEVREGTDYVAYLRTTDGAPAVRIGDGTPLALSPDGLSVLMMRQTNPPSFWLVPTGAGSPRALPLGNISVILLARFFRDGRRLALCSLEPGQTVRVWLYDLDDPGPRPTPIEGVGPFQISPDGERIASLDRTGRLRLFSTRGDELETVPQRFLGQQIAGWTEDGTALYLSTMSHPIQISRLDMRSGAITPHLTLTSVSARLGSTGIDRLLLSADGRSYAYTDSGWQSRLYLVEGLGARR